MPRFSSLHRKISRTVKKNFSEQTSFLASLVQARSANPFTPEESKASEPIEQEVAEIINERLREFNLRPKRMGVSQKRPNVVCYWGPRRFRKSLILNGHMDTVVPSEDYNLAPFSGAVKKGKLYGVGSLDMKGTLSAYVYAVKALLDLEVKLDGRLILEFVVDQEPGSCSSLGTAHLLSRGIRAKAAIIGEPGSGKIAIGHRGGYRFKLTTFGEAIHTGRRAWEQRERGRNAIADMATVMQALKSLEIPFKPARAFPGREPVFTFPTKIRGGSAINVVPDRCVAYGDVGLMPGNSDKQVKIWIQEKLTEWPDLRYEIEDLMFVPAVEIDRKEEIVEILSDISQSVLGRRPAIEGSGPWNDAWMLITRDVPTVCGFGPDGEGAHEGNEWVDLGSLEKMTEIYARAIVEYLGVRK